MSRIVTIDEKMRKSIVATKERNGWTNKQFAEQITKRLPRGKSIGSSGICLWQIKKTKSMSLDNFKAVYPLIAPDLKMFEWKPVDERVEKWIEKCETDRSSQGKLFDDTVGQDDSAGQTVEESTEPAPPTHPQVPEGVMLPISLKVGINVSCGKCGEALHGEYDTESNTITVEPCRSCVESSFDQMVQAFKSKTF